MKTPVRFAWIAVLIALSDPAGAQTPVSAPSPQPAGAPPARTAPRAGGGAKTSTLDFDADVIEGKRKAPEFFLQGESQKIGADEMVYLRDDFNDFHGVDRSRRPHLSQ
jgi:hypothetical protein